MDTSKEYIAICDCPEIQDKWSPLTGDFWTSENDSFIMNSTIGSGLDGLSNKIWLPRQDQLQEMMKIKRYNFYFGENDKKLDFMIAYKYDEIEFTGGTAEQCLLKKVMWEKHNKVWGKGGWRQILTPEEQEEDPQCFKLRVPI